MEVKLRKYQEKVAPKVFKYLAANKGCHPLVGMPTGAGKSYCIADVIEQAVRKWDVDVVVLSHVKEIVEQDYNSIKKFIPDVGLYSAGLKTKEIKKVTVAGIQSAYRKPELFRSKSKKPLLVIIDEAHLIPKKESSMYQKFFTGIGNHVRVGFTATIYGLGRGYIYGEDEVFDELVYDLTQKEHFNRLVKQGYLCRLVTKATSLELDPEGCRTTAGDYNEKDMSLRFDRESITNEAVDEIIKAGEDRKKWLIFAIDIDHAEHIAERLIRKGIPTNVVHSKMESDRDTVIKDYKNGTYRCLVNINILTTGFDVPSVDLVGMLRPTKSPVLHVQTVGRGLRIHDGKSDCLILDFAGNTSRLGPINDVQVLKKKKGKGGEPITKTCPDCQSIVPPVIKVCPDCGYEFQFKVNISGDHSQLDIVDEGKKWLKVDDVTMALHDKKGSPTSVKVTYLCGHRTFNEWVCVEHNGYAKHRANHWCKVRGISDGEINRAGELITRRAELNSPLEIQVDKSGKHFVITDVRF